MMRVLVACETSGVVRDAFHLAGHYVMSADLLPAETPGHHYQGDVRDVLDDTWDLMIAHPPCTYLSVSGYHWVYRQPGRMEKVLDALAFFREVLVAPIPRICIENPVGIASTRIAKPSQIIQPYAFGEDASKKTCLWLKDLPYLAPTRRFPGRCVWWNGKKVERWSNQTDSGQNRLGPSADRWQIRSRTYQGIADAMAQQWGEEA